MSCNATFLLSKTTDFYADSVEWCPFGPLSEFLVCGTYQLNEDTVSDEEEQSRQGNVVLYKFSTPDDGSANNFDLEAIDTVLTSGVLDSKWCPEYICDKAILAVACSDGKLSLFSLNKNEDKAKLHLFASEDLSVQMKKILLSLDWSSENQNVHKIVTSDSLGNLSYLQVREDSLSILKTWKAHDFESWIAAFDYERPQIVFSGGDDCCMKCWDLRNTPSPVFVNKSHSMGVTAISKSKKNPHLLVTGSYDENIYLWDTRQMKSFISEISVHGGVWRLKWHPNNPEYLLSASMHNGFHILSINDSRLEIEVSYDKHESLAYGVDWWHPADEKLHLTSELKKSKLNNVIASCSFYDRLLHVWGIDL